MGLLCLALFTCVYLLHPLSLQCPHSSERIHTELKSYSWDVTIAAFSHCLHFSIFTIFITIESYLVQGALSFGAQPLVCVSRIID